MVGLLLYEMNQILEKYGNDERNVIMVIISL